METSLYTNRLLPYEPLLKSTGDVDWQDTHLLSHSFLKKPFVTTRKNNLACAEYLLFHSSQLGTLVHWHHKGFPNCHSNWKKNLTQVNTA